jgi:hypothetical protein
VAVMMVVVLVTMMMSPRFGTAGRCQADCERAHCNNSK